MSKGTGKQCPTFPQCGPLSPGGRFPIPINDTNTSMLDEISVPGNEGQDLWVVIVNTGVYPVLFCVAIVGNLLGLGVVWKAVQTKKLSTYKYLFSLILSDVMYLVLNACRLLRSHYASVFELKTIILYFDKVCLQTSLAIVIVMCIERLIVLMKPLKAKSMLFSRHPWKIIGICFFINALTSLVRAIVPKNPIHNRSANTSTTEAGLTEDKTISIVLLLNDSVLNFLFPVILLFFTSTAISVAYCRIVKKQRMILKMERSRFSDNQNKATLTVFVVAAMYLLSLVPSLISKVLEYTGEEFSKSSGQGNEHKTIGQIATLMSLINAANDFIIFIMVSDNTRQLFKDMYCKCLLRSSAATSTTDSRMSWTRDRSTMKSSFVTVSENIGSRSQ